MSNWQVYQSKAGIWIAHRGFIVEPFRSWSEAYGFAYRHAVAAIHEVP